MNLEQVNIHNTNGILDDLRTESREAILADLTAVVFYHNASTLVSDVKAMLATIKEEVATLEARKEEAEGELLRLDMALIELKRKKALAGQKRTLIRAGKEQGEKPDIGAIDAEMRQIEHALSTARGEARTALNNLQVKQHEVRGLSKLLEQLQALDEPTTPALDVVLG